MRNTITPDIGADEFVAPTPSAAVSRKTHSAAGDFDVHLPLSGTPGIECRNGGATSDYQIVIAFANEVTVNGNPQAQVTSGIGIIGSNGVSNGGMVTASGNIVIVPLTGVANAQAISVTLNRVNTGAGTANIVIPMSLLIGDTNGDGIVNAGDTTQTRGRSGQTTDATNFRSDVNPDGFINSGDQIAVRSRSGTSLP